MINSSYNLKKDFSFLQSNLLNLRPSILELSNCINKLASERPNADKIQNCNTLIQSFLKENFYKSNLVKMKTCTLDMNNALELLGHYLYEIQYEPGINKKNVDEIRKILNEISIKSAENHPQ